MRISFGLLSVALATTGACVDAGASDAETAGPPDLDFVSWANGCYEIQGDGKYLVASGDGYIFEPGRDRAAKFFMKASDLGTYLLYDENAGYLVSNDGPLLRLTKLASDVRVVEAEGDEEDSTYSFIPGFVSGAEWVLETSHRDNRQYQLRNRKNDLLLTDGGLTANNDEAVVVTFVEASGCTPHPEMSLDATGTVAKTTFENGELYGIVDTHSHLLSNFGFGGGSIFHGAPFHRLGVEHALDSCEQFHGEMGRKDFFGYAFDTAGADGADLTSLLPDLIAGELSVDNHQTDGYPTFSEWPDARERSTHQQQYYKWLERAHLAGLRMVVQHATTNSVICHLNAGEGIQEVRYSCDDMVAVDRIIDETYNLERYIDAQAGGPGEGFFRVVQTPAEARAVIEDGKMAVVLGIETSNLFGCSLSPVEGGPTCDAGYVSDQLDAYYERGVRAIFPVHKYDNQFSPGDGDRSFIELGNFANSGYWSNFTLDCPVDVPSVFDNGDVFFGGLNMPRDEFVLPEPPNDFSEVPERPLGVLFDYISQIGGEPLEGAYCQNASFTPLGETLMEEMMQRGMIIEVDHLPQRSLQRAYEILEENDYPAAGTHGQNWGGRLYSLGGISKTGLGRCREAANPGAMFAGIRRRVAQITDADGYPAEGFGFDLNGFAGAPGPRMADGACPEPQADPITYPFTSIAGDVEFTQPMLGERTVDFNQEGFIHIGMLPELLQDARGDADSDADYDPLFKSAEGYIRMWEKAEARAAGIRKNRKR